ncbi:hypothetical protein NW762_000212 [Fusarium torreyae]|uniref:Uncharacterized protein n=1 Tax=Fusarium torreyae TaxID=1237075 RepID=A0A9W8SGR5_9HYPO|nr:hypothetical protein NW762_000212 [Fusarium torreyae]
MNDPQVPAFNPQALEVIISKIRLGIAVYEQTGDPQSIAQIREEQATETAKACKALWGRQTAPSAIFDLALGIRAGALSDTPIDESLYRGFIVAFCDIHKHREETVNQDICADMPTLLRSVSGTLDRGHLRHVLDRITEILSLDSDRFVQQIVTMLTDFLKDIERARDSVEEESEDEDLTDENGHEDGDELWTTHSIPQQTGN